jgi:hypothetical protein
MNRQLIDGMAASLRALARRGGDDAIKDPRRVRGKLADDHPENMAGRSTVLAALEIGVPERLKEADPQLIGAAMRRETVLLQTKFGTDKLVAAGAVEVWAQTLRIAYLANEIDAAPVKLSAAERLWRQFAYMRADIHQGFREAPFGMAIIAGGPIAALLAFLFWPEPAFNLTDPTTWPIDRQTAVVLHRSLLENCPSSEWRLVRRWRLIGSGEDGIDCLRSYWDLGPVHRIGNGAGRNGALLLSLTTKSGPCDADTEYESAGYCLRRKAPPGGGFGR